MYEYIVLDKYRLCLFVYMCVRMYASFDRGPPSNARRSMSDEGINEGRSQPHSPLHLHELQHDVESRDASAENLAPSTPLRVGSTGASAANKGLVQSIEKRFNRVLHFLTPSSNRQMPGGVLVARDEESSRVGSFSNLTRFKVCCVRFPFNHGYE